MRLHLLALLTLVTGATALIVPPALAQPDYAQPGSAEPGRPDFVGGATTGYFIWSDQDGLHVRWTSREGARSFTGEVTTDGAFVDVRTVEFEFGEDSLQHLGNTIAWRARTSSGIDGFDFALRRSADWARFALLIDGRPARPEQIWLGRRAAHPAGNPFIVRFGETFAGRIDRWPAYLRGQPQVRVVGEGYLIWIDDDTWRVRWSGRGVAREMSGMISTDGRLHDLRRVRLEDGDQTARAESLVAWETRGGGGVDGLDFRTTGDRLTFTLLVDGQLAPSGQILLGAGGVRPQRNPFRITRSGLTY